MKRFLTVICVLCLLASLTGCGNTRGGTFEDVTYPFTWTEQRDDSVLLRFTQPAPDGYEWQAGPGSVVQVEDSRTEKDGTVSFRIIPLINGEDSVEFKLVSTDGVAYVLYTLYVDFSVDAQAVLSVTGCYEVTGEQLSTVGDYPVSYVWTDEGLQMTVAEGDWTYTHENDWFIVSEDIEDGYYKLLVYRQDSASFYSRYMNDTSAWLDTAEQSSETTVGTISAVATNTDTTAVENPSTPEMDTAVDTAGQALQEYAAEKDDVLYLHSYTAGVSYRFDLHMDTDGRITVTEFTPGEYTGETPDYSGMQLHYDPVTGETRASFEDTYQDEEDGEEAPFSYTYYYKDESDYPAYSGVPKTK